MLILISKDKEEYSCEICLYAARKGIVKEAEWSSGEKTQNLKPQDIFSNKETDCCCWDTNYKNAKFWKVLQDHEPAMESFVDHYKCYPESNLE